MSAPCYVSLGYDCQVAYQLKRLGLRAAAYPFDRIETPYESLIALLENDFADWLDELEHVPGKFIRDVRYRTHHLHEDPAQPAERAMYLRRIARFRALSEPAVFVRRTGDRREGSRIAAALAKRFPALPFRLVIVGNAVWRAEKCIGVTIEHPDPWDWRGLNAEWDRIAPILRAASPARYAGGP